MDRRAWKPFLERWSEEWAALHDAEPPSGTGEPVGETWLGFPPASEEEVREAEARLGRTLPPSFREFLLTTNGWRNAGHFVWRLRGTDDLGWLRDLDPMWVESYGTVAHEYEGAAEQAATVRRALLISGEADAGVLFLDPEDVDEHGEWAAYELFTWTAVGPERRGSFRELMLGLYTGFHAIGRLDDQT
ncbi:SMI1/KNR4 family protein [Streptosporangium sandarakinum]|uniref:SMI1/KNR4 family protein n=1 Tax=Streptosporangium sandarakinum TaxID=1260955 RepID=UPI0034403E3A